MSGCSDGVPGRGINLQVLKTLPYVHYIYISTIAYKGTLFGGRDLLFAPIMSLDLPSISLHEPL